MEATKEKQAWTHLQRANTRQPGNSFFNTFYVPGWGETRKPGPVLRSTDWGISAYKAAFPRTCNNCRHVQEEQGKAKEKVWYCKNYF